MTKIYYEKVGKKYLPVSQFDSWLNNSFKDGFHLVIARPGSKTVVFDIEPEYHRLIAASKVVEDAMVSVMLEKSKLRLQTSKLTKKQIDIWHEFDKAMNNKMSLERASIQEVVESGIEALMQEAKKNDR